ncbi:MAG TPA: hypothetical protein VGL03_08815 [Thermoanaerobaculia bacterium]|jgi:hypothetical protein
MKRFVLAVACIAFSAPLWAQKMRVPPHAPAGAPTVHTITGSPLTLDIGDDTSMQVYNSNVPGTGQFYPPGCNPGETADWGVFAGIGGVIYGPDFNNHPCGSASNSYTPWTVVSFTPVSGTGTAVDPFTQVIVVDAGTTGLRLTETLTYVNGSATANIALAFSNVGAGAVTWDTFDGADLFLADNDAGFPFATPPTASGSHGADASCTTQLQYTISVLGTTPADRYSANGYSTVWSEISAGSLSNTVAPGCLDDGAALEWTARTLNPGGTLTINSGVSFTGQAVPQGAIVPTLSPLGLAALILLLAVVGYVLVRRMSLGA